MKRINIKKFFKKYKKIIFISIAILIIAGLSYILISGTLSKYVNKSNYNHGLTTSSFQFVSNKLGKTAVDNIINDYNYGNVSFTISNGVNGEITKGNISYNISCTVPTGYTCTINNSSVNYADSFTDNNTLQTKSYTLKVTKTTGTLSQVTATVTATSTSPYVSTIQGNFILNIADTTTTPTVSLLTNGVLACEYSVINNSGVSKSVTVGVDTTKFIFDETSPMFTTKTSSTMVNSDYSSITANVEAHGFKKVVIFKVNGDACTSSSITVS